MTLPPSFSAAVSRGGTAAREDDATWSGRSLLSVTAGREPHLLLWSSLADVAVGASMAESSAAGPTARTTTWQ